MPLVCRVPDHLDLHPYKGLSKYLEQFWSYGIYTEICEKKYKKIPIYKKSIFHQNIGNQLKRTWHHMKAETLKKTCVKFEAHRLNTLRENRICKKANQKVNQECAARPDNPILITGFFLRKTRLKIIIF